jgi:hypothetical protein
MPNNTVINNTNTVITNTNIVKNTTTTTKTTSTQPKLQNNYGNVCLDLNPDNYPKKYRKFVGELVTLLNYVALANV